MIITPYLEQLVHEGKAQYKTISMGACQEFIIPVPQGTYIVVTGYEYLPIAPQVGTFADIFDNLVDLIQYVNFVNDTNFYPYMHTLNYVTQPIQGVSPNRFIDRIGSYQSRETYIVSKKNLAVYFTRMNAVNLTLTSNVLQQESPIFDVLGYATQSAVTTIQNYNDNGAGRVNPLTDKYTVPQYTPNPSRYNQLYTLPNAGGALDLTAINNQSLGKARANHITVHYFEINEQPPTNLI